MMAGVPNISFYQRVYQIVEQIPAGCVATYGQVAMLAGSPRAARQVGYAMSRVSSERKLPCHRVVNQCGELAPDYVFGSREFQRVLLESEGITFCSDGRIDLKKHMWKR